MNVVSPDGLESEKVLDYVFNLNLSRCGVHVCIASYVGKDELPMFQRIPLTENLTSEFREVVIDALHGWRQERAAQQLVLWPHMTGTMPQSYEIEYLNLDMYDGIRQQLDGLAQPVISLPTFKAEDDVVAGIRFYAIIVQPPSGEPVYFFRTYTPKRELARSKWFGAWLTDGQFDLINKKAFLFDNRIDCFSVGKLMFIVQKSNFQRIFRFFEMTAQAAEQTLAVIKRQNLIKNFDEFAEDCQAHLQKLAKLKNIADQPYLSRIGMTDIRNVISRLNLPIEVDVVNGTEMLVHNRRDKWALLKLFDDDYVQSLMTRTVYEASSKRPLA